MYSKSIVILIFINASRKEEKTTRCYIISFSYRQRYNKVVRNAIRIRHPISPVNLNFRTTRTTPPRIKSISNFKKAHLVNKEKIPKASQHNCACRKNVFESETEDRSAPNDWWMDRRNALFVRDAHLLRVQLFPFPLYEDKVLYFMMISMSIRSAEYI